jgi:hypothetical protein
MFGLPPMFKMLLKQLLSDVKIKIDADQKTVAVSKANQTLTLTFEQLESMINDGQDKL